MNFFIDHKLTFINSSLWIFVGEYLLNSTEILSPVIHDWKVLLFIRKWNVLSEFLLVRFVFTSLVFLHLLSILLEFDIVLSLFYLVYILLKADLLLS